MVKIYVLDKDRRVQIWLNISTHEPLYLDNNP